MSDKIRKNKVALNFNDAEFKAVNDAVGLSNDSRAVELRKVVFEWAAKVNKRHAVEKNNSFEGEGNE